MNRKLYRSNSHFRKALERLPLGVSSSFRYWGDERTVYVKRGRGARVWDLDDNPYVDYRLGYGPVILGHCHPEVDAAARAGQEIGGVFALSTERELAVAQLIHEMVPAAELVRFANSGTEAVMGALRVARGFTGKDGYVLFEGSYHGLFDAAMWLVDPETSEPGSEPRVMSYGDGVPDMVRRLLWLLPYNDLERLEDVLRRNGDRIGAVLIEPILGNACGIPATPEFIRGVRELCTRYDVLMIADEVKTGFRVARGGGQEHYGVKADLCTLAKAIANGYPLAAIAGREAVMRYFDRDRVAHGGTYNGQCMGLAAAEATLKILRDSTALSDIAVYGEDLREGMSRILSDWDIPHSFAGHPSMSGLFIRESPPKNYREWKCSDYAFYDALARNLIDEGVMCEPDSREPWFVSAAHDASCLRETLTAFESAVASTADEAGDAQHKGWVWA